MGHVIDHDIEVLEQINDLNAELDEKINQGFGYLILEPIYNKISQLTSELSKQIAETPPNEKFYLVH